MTDLGTLGDTYSYPSGINDRGPGGRLELHGDWLPARSPVESKVATASEGSPYIRGTPRSGPLTAPAGSVGLRWAGIAVVVRAQKREASVRGDVANGATRSPRCDRYPRVVQKGTDSTATCRRRSVSRVEVALVFSASAFVSKGAWRTLADKPAPVDWVRRVFPHTKLRRSQRSCSRTTVEQRFVEVPHQLECRVVGDLPETHDQRLGSCKDQRPSEPEHALPVLHRSETSVTGGQNHKFCPSQIEAACVFSCQKAVLGILGSLASSQPCVGRGEGETGSKHGVLG